MLPARYDDDYEMLTPLKRISCKKIKENNHNNQNQNGFKLRQVILIITIPLKKCFYT